MPSVKLPNDNSMEEIVINLTKNMPRSETSEPKDGAASGLSVDDWEALLKILCRPNRMRIIRPQPEGR